MSVKLHEELELRLRESGMTVEQAAEEVGVNVETFERYVNGCETPDRADLERVCNRFDIEYEQYQFLLEPFKLPPEVISDLSDAKQHAEQALSGFRKDRDVMRQNDDEKIKHELLWKTHDLMDELKKALDSVENIWNDKIGVPAMDLYGVQDDTGPIRKHFSCEDWNLFIDTDRLWIEAINFMFD